MEQKMQLLCCDYEKKRVTQLIELQLQNFKWSYCDINIKSQPLIQGTRSLYYSNYHIIASSAGAGEWDGSSFNWSQPVEVPHQRPSGLTCSPWALPSSKRHKHMKDEPPESFGSTEVLIYHHTWLAVLSYYTFAEAYWKSHWFFWYVFLGIRAYLNVAIIFNLIRSVSRTWIVSSHMKTSQRIYFFGYILKHQSCSEQCTASISHAIACLGKKLQ